MFIELSLTSSLWVDSDGITGGRWLNILSWCSLLTWMLTDFNDFPHKGHRLRCLSGWCELITYSITEIPLIIINTGSIFHLRMIKFDGNMLLAKIINFENNLFENMRELLYNYISKYITSSITWSHRDVKI